MWRTITVLVILSISFFHAGGQELGAQQVRSVPNAAELAKNLHTIFDLIEARMVLQQVRGPEDRQDLDALADSLVSFALTAGRSEEREEYHSARGAISAIALAGSGKNGEPYPGAAERLFRIAQTGENVGMKAITSLYRLPDRDEGLAYIRRIAIADDNRLSHFAVEALASLMESEGLAVLRDIHREGLVKDPRALRRLEHVAASRGWGPGPPRR